MLDGDSESVWNLAVALAAALGRKEVTGHPGVVTWRPVDITVRPKGDHRLPEVAETIW